MLYKTQVFYAMIKVLTRLRLETGIIGQFKGTMDAFRIGHFEYGFNVASKKNRKIASKLQ